MNWSSTKARAGSILVVALGTGIMWLQQAQPQLQATFPRATWIGPMFMFLGFVANVAQHFGEQAPARHDYGVVDSLPATEPLPETGKAGVLPAPLDHAGVIAEQIPENGLTPEQERFIEEQLREEDHG